MTKQASTKWIYAFRGIWEFHETEKNYSELEFLRELRKQYAPSAMNRLFYLRKRPDASEPSEAPK